MTKSFGLFRDVRASLPSPWGLLPLLVALVVWQTVQKTNSPYFPPPSIWWDGVKQLATDGRLWAASAATIQTILVGLALAIMIGVALGVWLGLSPTASRAFGPLLEFCRAMPPAAIVPLAILFLGYDERMKLTIVAISASWPIMLNTISAVQQLHPLLSDVARSMRLTTFTKVREIVLPATIPAILLGVRIALPLCIILAILVEILTSIEGIGALMIAAQRNFQSGQVYGLLVLVGLFGFVLNGGFTVIETIILRRWPPRSVAL